jgi:hypothetical protein
MALFFAWAWYSGSKAVKKKRADMAEKLKSASTGDKLWDETALRQQVDDTFVKYQKDWSEFNTKSMQTYMTAEYFQHASMMMEALAQADRTNAVDKIKVNRTEIDSFSNPDGTDSDNFIASIDVDLRDILITTSSGQQLYTKEYPSYLEHYKFKRHDNDWLLDGIDTSTASLDMLQTSVRDFAKANNLFFSLDWGYLLLPAKGQLFGNGKFGTSDINNHCIGKYNDVLIQLYTYIPEPDYKSETGYVIAQTSVPKNYGEISIRRKGVLSVLSKVKHLTKLETEWADFNKKYEVLASDGELATSFELLNPKYMEQLEAVEFDVNIQVVDNIIYLYTSDLSADYNIMLGLLKSAFKEMRI